MRTAPPVSSEDLLADALAGRDVPAGDLEAAVAASRRVVVLDDDPTGTQSIRDLPVLTTWSPEDVAWAFAQGTAGFFVLTNSRSLAPGDAARINREIAQTVHTAAAAAGIDVVFASRGDSTLRGHFPLETDVLIEESAAAGRPIDGTLVVPALIEPGRVTVDSVHWMRTDTGMIPVGDSEFARDRTFGYRNSDLRDWVGQRSNPPADASDLRAVPPAPDDSRRAVPRGLVVVGSHVDLTTRQLSMLRKEGGITEVELEVERLLDAGTRDEHLEHAAHRVGEPLAGPARIGDVVLRTSRALVAGRDAAHSLGIARSVSAALVATVQSVLTSVRPAFVLAKGGITSSDTATHGLGIRRAWSRGTLLPGTVSVWEPVDGPAAGIPYAVFAGNVGNDAGLHAAVTRLKEAAC